MKKLKNAYLNVGSDREDLETLPVGSKCPGCGIKQKYTDVTIHKKGVNCSYANQPHHTPTPWKVNLRFRNNLPNDYVITNGKWGSFAIASSDNEADAAFIVRAVNAHEELIALVKALMPFAMEQNNLLQEAGEDHDLLELLLDTAEKTIAKAEGK